MNAKGKKLLLFLSVLGYTLLGLELGARLFRLDALAMKPLLMFTVEPDGHDALYRPSADARLLFGLRPGARAEIKGSAFTINSLGFRGTERQAARPEGVFRIILAGGSNIFAPSVSDGGTLPAQLEAALNKYFKGRFEVWNAGVPGYSLAQASEWAANAARLYSPDIVLVQRSNDTRRIFLYNAPFTRYFRQNPELFRENLAVIPFQGCAAGRFLFRHSALWRLGVVLYNLGVPDYKAPSSGFMTAANDAAFLALQDGLAPGAALAFVPYQKNALPEGAKCPVLDIMKPDYLPDSFALEYFEAHPPATVYAHNAILLARELALAFPGKFVPKAGLPPVPPVRPDCGYAQKESGFFLDFVRVYRQAGRPDLLYSILGREKQPNTDKFEYNLVMAELAAQTGRCAEAASYFDRARSRIPELLAGAGKPFERILYLRLAAAQAYAGNCGARRAPASGNPQLEDIYYQYKNNLEIPRQSTAVLERCSAGR